MKNSIPNAAKINPTDFVIFGGGGDLSIRKIIPALFWRFVDKQIDTKSNIIICLHKKTELETILNLIKPHTFNSINLGKTLQNNWKNFHKLLSLITLDLVTGEGINDLILLLNKKDVQNEINVPPQNEITYRLKFSATELIQYLRPVGGGPSGNTCPK